MDGVLGDVILVNGAPWPVLEVDRGPLPPAAPERLQRPPLPAGARPAARAARRWCRSAATAACSRAPVAHDASTGPGRAVRRRRRLRRFRAGHAGTLRQPPRRRAGPAEVMRFRRRPGTAGRRRGPGTGSSRSSRCDPAAPATTPAPSSSGRTRGDARLDDQRRALPPGPRRCRRRGSATIEIWRFITDFHHPVHVHLNPFQVLRRDSRRPGPYDARLEGHRRRAARRGGRGRRAVHRLRRARYLLHCHNLEHEDMAMMADFVTG